MSKSIDKEILADIRNKLSPISSLITILDKIEILNLIEEKKAKYLLEKIELSKQSIEYLKNLKVN